jgi:hypothetical protein
MARGTYCNWLDFNLSSAHGCVLVCRSLGMNGEEEEVDCGDDGRERSPKRLSSARRFLPFAILQCSVLKLQRSRKWISKYTEYALRNSRSSHRFFDAQEIADNADT